MKELLMLPAPRVIGYLPRMSGAVRFTPVKYFTNENPEHGIEITYTDIMSKRGHHSVKKCRIQFIKYREVLRTVIYPNADAVLADTIKTENRLCNELRVYRGRIARIADITADNVGAVKNEIDNIRRVRYSLNRIRTLREKVNGGDYIVF